MKKLILAAVVMTAMMVCSCKNANDSQTSTTSTTTETSTDTSTESAVNSSTTSPIQ
jgi:hypothetical protein